ncbi:acyl-CoA dehydrogenase [Marinomonas piezotolerans]|uniref:3-methylmercaptopropionyl-CoA dehydrogenase n=1 Tax=Marinomonas piezotolerans TaxID=2213058 RepID=A0A370UDY0_9GAMM|nr:acyl-CoA dehydrogenase [Marinomonas piezotolerans]RDL45961.1 acyl-CoA dehydrogenase [Marinomonas piezotolerans]
MSGYRYPVDDVRFCLEHIANIERIAAHFPNYSYDFLDPILSEAAKFSEQRLAPTNRDGDKNWPTLSNLSVQETIGFKEAYQDLCEAGWTTLSASEEYGGQGLPRALEVAVNEGVQSANLAFSLCPLLTQGAIDAIETHANDALKQTYLPKMISGEWTGTMNLTEPSAGSDLSAIKTKAVKEEDHYRVFGQKIFITWGDHQMTDNIIHLVLARLPDAPEGVKGISLFLVPKFVLDSDGNPDQRNDVFPISLEHKLGIHGSPTCVMQFGDNEGAVGYLVGEENKGLAAMFTMMNNARQSVGLQGLAIAERAYQMALEYAFERKQGSRRGSKDKTAIAYHGDVGRMLWQMSSILSAMRAFMYTASVESDLKQVDKTHQQRTDLYTPIVKGWMTELAQEITSLSVQVHGGMGFIEETGIAQMLRDARILPIYEGTNGIQALDLVGRKLVGDNGVAMIALLKEIRSDLSNISSQEAALFAPHLEHLENATNLLLQQHLVPEKAAYDYLMLSGYVIGGWLMLRGNQSDKKPQSWGNKTSFYLANILPRAAMHYAAMHSFKTKSDTDTETYNVDLLK